MPFWWDALGLPGIAAKFNVGSSINSPLKHCMQILCRHHHLVFSKCSPITFNNTLPSVLHKAPLLFYQCMILPLLTNEETWWIERSFGVAWLQWEISWKAVFTNMADLAEQGNVLTLSTMANQLGECWWLLLHFILFCIFTKFFIICSLANILFLTSLRSKYSIWATGHTYSVTAYRDHQVNCLLQREAAHTVTTGKEKNWFFSISEMFVLVTRLQGSATFA